MITLPPEARAAVHSGYLSGQFTVPILCQIYNASEDEVLSLLRSLGVKGLFTTEEKLAVVRLYMANASQYTIARELKMCRKKVRAVLKSLGVGA